jgi:hypothetical protein
MFSDPFSNLMLVLLLFFCGLLVMFIFMMRNLESHWRNHEETRMQLSLHLSDLETKLDTLLRLAGAGSAGSLGGESLYEQAVAPAWAGAQEYDSVAGQDAEPDDNPDSGRRASDPEYR